MPTKARASAGGSQRGSPPPRPRLPGDETRSLGAALDVTNLLIESRTKRRHAASVGLKDDQEAILGFGIENEVAAAITQIWMELVVELIAVVVFDVRDRIPHSYLGICLDRR